MYVETTCKLSICIPTFNRAQFIGETLASIITQSTEECEIVVLDGASTDNTEQIVKQYAAIFPRLRYIKRHTNGGFDRDLDCVVDLAVGEYAWLMSDDDLLRPGAISAILEAIRHDYSLVIVNAEVRDKSLANLLQPARLTFKSDRTYAPKDMDALCVDTCSYMTFVGCIVIKRAIWLERQRTAYYDSDFVHVGVVFQRELPGDALVLVTPWVTIRFGNALWWSKQVKVFMINWPALVWSLPVAESTKAKVCKREPWTELKVLLMCRAFGSYSLNEYRNLIRPRIRSIRESLIPALVARLPGPMVNAAFLLYYTFVREHDRGLALLLLRNSPFHIRNWGVPEA